MKEVFDSRQKKDSTPPRVPEVVHSFIKKQVVQGRQQFIYSPQLS
jgi:hypothetical protein